MYNAHRGIPPPGPAGPPPSSRLGELLDQVRQEFDVQGGRTSEYEHQRKYHSLISHTAVRCLVQADAPSLRVDHENTSVVKRMGSTTTGTAIVGLQPRVSLSSFNIITSIRYWRGR